MSNSTQYKIPDDMTTYALRDITPSYNIKFSNADNEQLGAIDFNGPGLTFEGNAELSAIIFIDWLAKTWSKRLQEEYDKGFAAGKDLSENKA